MVGQESRYECVCVFGGEGRSSGTPWGIKPMTMGYKTLPGIVEVGDTR